MSDQQNLLKLLNIKEDDYERIVDKIRSKQLDNVDDLVLRCLALEIFLGLDNINSATINMIMKMPQIFVVDIVKPITNLLTTVLYCSDTLTIKCNKDIKEIIMAHYNCLKQIVKKDTNKENQIKTIYSIIDVIYEMESLVDQFVFDDEEEEAFEKLIMNALLNGENTTIH